MHEDSVSYEDEFSLRDYIFSIWESRNLILYSALFFFSLFGLYSFLLKDVYTSSSVLYIVEDQDAGGMGSLLNQYSGLASSAGVSLPTSSTSKTDIFLATIESKEFFTHLLSFEGVKENLFAAKKYDMENKKVIYDTNYFNPEDGTWITEEPDPLDSYYQFKEDGVMSVYYDDFDNMISISVTHISPDFAYYFCNLIIQEVNNLIRVRHLNESNSALEYLNKQYTLSPQKNIRESINQLVEAQMKIQMLANVRKDYMIRPLDKPFRPNEKSGPFRIKIIALGFLLGLFFGVFGVLLKLYLFPKDVK
tara:strand:- start:2471 stop:3388 length:918 start_codon:yes stop_codon:yes gene_type:complete